MMSSIIENRITRTVIIFLMIGPMILPVPLFKNISITPLMISIAMADSIPPYIGHDPITKSKAGESIHITATIDDESDINEVWLYYMKGNDSDYKKVIMNKTDGKSNQFDAVIPYTEVVGEKLVYFIEARDKFGNMSQAGSQSKPFSIKVIGPLPKPEISHIPITKSGANEPIEVKAKIDNQNIIEKTTLYYQRGGESRWGNIPMVPKEGNLYQATIPGENIKSNRVKYYIEVVDKFGKQTVSKDREGEPFVIEIGKVSSGGDRGDSIFKKWWFWTVLLAVVGGAAAAFSSGGGGSPGSATTGSVGVE